MPSTRGGYFQFPKFPCNPIKRGSCPAKANFNLNFAFWGPAFADVALRCLLRCGFALVLQGLASVPFHNVGPVVACFSTSWGGVCGWGVGGGRGWNGQLLQLKVLLLLNAIVVLSGWGTSCGSMGSETRTCTDEMSIGCIVWGLYFSRPLGALAVLASHFAPRFRRPNLRESLFSMPKGFGAEICSVAIRFCKTLGVGFWRSRVFVFFCFFFENSTYVKNQLSTRERYFHFP